MKIRFGWKMENFDLSFVWDFGNGVSFDLTRFVHNHWSYAHRNIYFLLFPLFCLSVSLSSSLSLPLSLSLSLSATHSTHTLYLCLHTQISGSLYRTVVLSLQASLNVDIISPIIPSKFLSVQYESISGRDWLHFT